MNTSFRQYQRSAATLQKYRLAQNQHVGWAVKPINRRLRWASFAFSPSYVSAADGKRSICAGWVEHREIRRQGLFLLGFLAFNSYASVIEDELNEVSVVRNFRTTAADAEDLKVLEQLEQELEKGGRQ